MTLTPFNKKDNVAIGWLLQENTNKLVEGFSRNIAEYYYVLLDKSEFKQYIGNDIDELTQQSVADGYDQILIIKQGVVFADIDTYLWELKSNDPVIIASGENVLDFTNPNPTIFSRLIYRILNTQISFLANTDNKDLADSYIPDYLEDIKFTKLITSAGGLNSILIPFALNFSQGCSVDVLDVSNIALLNCQRWNNEFDGKDSIGFVETLKKSMELDGDTIITRGAGRRVLMQEQLDEQIANGFTRWFNQDHTQIRYKYAIHDFMNPDDTDKLCGELRGVSGNVYVHLSNIYHYQATAFYYNLKDRVNMRNELLNTIKYYNLGDRVMVTSMDPQMQGPPVANWVNDIDTIEVLPKYQQFPWNL
tara:strand:+ start:504 stop:1592 length:1089 start_codon:yes stop_codon:yes gene_type:complete